MRKFEIINNTWIKYVNQSLKIDEIKKINGIKWEAGYEILESSTISLEVSSGLSIILPYKKDEESIYKQDLAFLENLLYNRK